MKKEEHGAGMAALVFCLLLLASCDAVLGPPGSEPPVSPIPAATPYDMFVDGEPQGSITLRGGYYLWKLGDGWHLRVARTDVPRPVFYKDVFSGSVSVENGFVRNLHLHNAHPIDVVQTDPGTVGFKIETDRDIRGFDFRVQPGQGLEYCLLFQLQINGVMEPAVVHLGRSMFVPGTLPLRMCFRR